MRIAIEALSLIPGKTGGIETYVRNLVCQMVRIAPENDYLIAVGYEAAGEFAACSPRLEEFNADYKHKSLPKSHRLIRSLQQCWEFHKKLRSWAPDVVHCAMSFPKPPWGARNMIVTVHDVGVIELARMWGDAKPGVAGFLMWLAARKASMVITVSEFAAARIADRFSIPMERIYVTYNGVDRTQFRPPDELSGNSTIRATLQKYKLGSEYVFYPAHTHYHKNHAGLIKALRIVSERYGIQPMLVLTGAPSYAHDHLMQVVHRLGVERQVRWLGRVPIEDLVALYWGAKAMIFPSFYEGFGLPVVEAMACGCPVACSNTTATAEVAGDAALTFDPSDPEAIAEAIFRVLTDSGLRAKLIEKGLLRSQKFSWENTARGTLDVYERVVRG
jgi:glycosyltransferase involved in cell wall biosynthesis